MTREEFILKFIMAFNKDEKDKGSSSKEHWKSKGFTGEFLYYLRNILIHETIDYSTLDNVKNSIGFQEVLNMFGDIGESMDDASKLNCIKYISDNYGSYFASRGYNRMESERYHYYQKCTKISGLNKNIFIYDNTDTNAGFMSIGVHSYNYERNENNQIISDDIHLGIYVRSEASGYVMINYYELNKDIPITLEFNQNEEWFKLVIPELEKYDAIRNELNLNGDIDFNLTKAEFNEKLNKLYSAKSNALRRIIHEIEVSFNEIKADLVDINIV